MSLTVYATADDLTNGDWLDGAPAPDNVDRLLRAASFVVAQAANRDPYGDTPTGNDVEPLRDATCAQTAAWIKLGIDPQSLAVDVQGPVRSSKILSASVDRDTTVTAGAVKSLAQGELVPEAETILMAAGLLSMATATGDTCGALPAWGQPVVNGGVFGPNAASMDWPFV